MCTLLLCWGYEEGSSANRSSATTDRLYSLGGMDVSAEKQGILMCMVAPVTLALARCISCWQ